MKRSAVFVAFATIVAFAVACDSGTTPPNDTHSASDAVDVPDSEPGSPDGKASDSVSRDADPTDDGHTPDVRSWGSWEATDVSPPSTTKLDILWVVDNSGSMCQEQQMLREEFGDFVDGLRASSTDFRLAVTTTQMNNALFESIAEPGRIQSTPHPPVGFDRSCNYSTDENGDPIEGDFAALRRQIEAAVACTNNPADYQHLLDWTDDELRCAIEGQEDAPEACDNAGLEHGDLNRADLFPCTDRFGKRCDRSQYDRVYRDIPKVLRPAEYRGPDGALEVERLRDDFRCMSYVGTRGSAQEQGLRAAVRAVSPEMTGGTVEAPNNEDAPNHGFLRKDAETMIIFVTDENDCSHRGTAIDDASERNACGEVNCYFPTDGDDQSPLLGTDKLAKKLVSKLAASKGVDELDKEDVHIASFHGDYERYAGNEPDTCDGETMKSLVDELEVCGTPRGTVRSGDRYEDFMLEFDQIFPPRSAKRNGHLPGLMCKSEFGPQFEQLGTLAGERSETRCIEVALPSCQTDGDCPPFAHASSSATACSGWDGAADRVCASAVEVRLAVDGTDGDSETRLRETGYCIPSSIGQLDDPSACVVSPDRYQLTSCSPDAKHFRVDWSDPFAGRVLDGLDIRVRYRSQ